MAGDVALETLASLLGSGRARVIVNKGRLAPSAIYDLQYRMFIVAAAFEIYATPYLSGQQRIRSSQLKLLQFVAFRPWLVPVIRAWGESQGYAQQTVFSPQQLRRGFLGDQMHDDVVAFLVARGAFSRMGTHLVSDVNASILRQLHTTAIELGLFPSAFQALRDLKDVRITNSMLEGW